MRLAIGYSSKNQVELTSQTLPRLLEFIPRDICQVHWIDGSDDLAALRYFNLNAYGCETHGNVKGGADAAIVWKLSKLLADENYTHIGLMENDVLLDKDWYEPTMELFEKGKRDGLDVGAVSARSYVDRILIQREGYAIMHNLGAGFVIFTRQAAAIVLQSFRTQWWQDNVRLFAQLCGIDLRTYAAFRANEQWVTTDWGFEAQLARQGLASLALTPAKCQMLGQNPPLAEQGLELTTGPIEQLRNEETFKQYRLSLAQLGAGALLIERPQILHRSGSAMIFFPHQVGMLGEEFGSQEARGPYNGNWRLKWTQGLGPFSYRVGPGGGSLRVPISGSCSFLLSGGTGTVTGSTVSDIRSGFRAEPVLHPEAEGEINLMVPGGVIPRHLEE